MKGALPKVKPVILTARRVKQFLRIGGGTQKMLAFSLGLHPQTISKVVRGKLKTKITGGPAFAFRLAESLMKSGAIGKIQPEPPK